jgi:hypothetical protein
MPVPDLEDLAQPIARDWPRQARIVRNQTLTGQPRGAISQRRNRVRKPLNSQRLRGQL